MYGDTCFSSGVVHVYVYVYIHTYVYDTCKCIHTYMYIVQSCKHMFTPAYVYVHIHKCICRLLKSRYCIWLMLSLSHSAQLTTNPAPRAPAIVSLLSAFLSTTCVLESWKQFLARMCVMKRPHLRHVS